MSRIVKFAAFAVIISVAIVDTSLAQDIADVASAAMDAIREAKIQSSATSEIKAIFTKAVEAEEDGNINFCGFYTGMSKNDANRLADFYKLQPGEWAVKTLSSSTSVYELWFNLRTVRKLTKGGNSFNELAQAVANRVGSLERKSVSGGKEWWEYTTIDDVTAIMSEQDVREAEIKLFFDNRSVNSGLTIFDKKFQARVNREEAARAGEEAKRAQEQAEAERIKKERMAEKLMTAEKMGIPEKAKEAIARIASDMVHIPGKKYLMSKYEVTQALWFAVMEEAPSQFIGANLPVENVSWNDCKTFLEKLNMLPEIQMSGYTFRLPSTEEWEYACRAGATGDYCQLVEGTEISKETLSEIAWFDFNSNGITHPVGQKKPNAFGLYDMLGNIVEWTDTQDDGGYICCGSSWISPASYSESSARIVHAPSFLYDTLGFRLVCDEK